MEIHVDGNHFKGSRSIGYGICGGALVGEKVQDVTIKLAVRVDHEHMCSFFGLPASTPEDYSNPTMELAGAAHALRLLATGEIRVTGSALLREACDEVVIRICADYNGVANWINGAWKARAPHIRHMLDYALRQKNICECDLGMKIVVCHVPGHSGNWLNEIADRLSKGQVDEADRLIAGGPTCVKTKAPSRKRKADRSGPVAAARVAPPEPLEAKCFLCKADSPEEICDKCIPKLDALEAKMTQIKESADDADMAMTKCCVCGWPFYQEMCPNCIILAKDILKSASLAKRRRVYHEHQVMCDKTE